MRALVSIHHPRVVVLGAVRPGDGRVNVEESAEDNVEIVLHNEAIEGTVTAIVAALPAPRRAALLRTLQTAWYAESAREITPEVGVAMQRAIDGIEDERFEETR